MDYSHVFEHPLDPRNVRVLDKLLLAQDGGFVEALYLDGPVTVLDGDHVVKVGGEIRRVNGLKLYELPLGYIEDTAVYPGDYALGIHSGITYRLLSTVNDSVLCAVGDRDKPCALVSLENLTLSRPKTKCVGFVAITSRYDRAPEELFGRFFAERHIFRDRADAERTFPHSQIAEVVWYDEVPIF